MCSSVLEASLGVWWKLSLFLVDFSFGRRDTNRWNLNGGNGQRSLNSGVDVFTMFLILESFILNGGN